MEYELVEERTYLRRREFLELDPSGQTPVLVMDDGRVIPGAGPIAEFIDETCGERLGNHRLMPENPVDRVAVRRLLDWFNTKFFAEVTGYLVLEKVYKRSMTAAQGGGSPDSTAVRAAQNNLQYHLQYLGYLLSHSNWLAGDRLTMADLAAAAHLSCVDFLGDLRWNDIEDVKHWYATIKSRPSFRSLLADRIAGQQPAPAYANLDF